MSSEHVVVKRELLVRLSSSAFAAASSADNAHIAFKHQDVATEAQKVLSAPSPEMVPMSDVQPLIEHITQALVNGPIPGMLHVPAVMETLAAFNAKFKPNLQP